MSDDHRTMREAIDEGKEVYALVLRGQTIKLVPGKRVKPDELLCWTHTGITIWHRVAHVVTQWINDPLQDIRRNRREELKAQ